MSTELTDYKRIMKLLSKCKEVSFFEYEGVFYKGDRVKAIKDFCNSQPYPADFHVWLQDNYQQFTTT